MCVSGPETHVYACLRSSPPYFDKKTKYFYKLVLLSEYGGGRPEDIIKRAFQGLKRTFMHVSGLPHHILIIKPDTL